MTSDLENLIAQHDSRVAGSGLDIWIGCEPTFTLRTSEAAQWLSQALGEDKQTYAQRMLRELCLRHPGSVILRTVGRQYGGEDRARWSYGLYQRRDGAEVWAGPPDPMIETASSGASGELEHFLVGIEKALFDRQWHCRRLTQCRQSDTRLLVSRDADKLSEFDSDDPRLERPSLHRHKLPATGLADNLAQEGYYLFTLNQAELPQEGLTTRVDLPGFSQVGDFLECLSILGKAATDAQLPRILLQGYPPPVDERVSWVTITPDPAVIEINQAPEPDITRFYAASVELFDIAEGLGLSPFRMQYTGTVADSGGGGQFTLGGRSADSSPFFVQPRLLPRLLRYINQHPSLSYLFATNYVGGASQSPRSDEGMRDTFYELGVALEQLERQNNLSAEFLHTTLAPFLADPSGNAHRSELNIEKLWNPFLPQRGCLGLVEFRAFRMPFTPERAVAIGMLLRAICALLANNDRVPDLKDWGDDLHDRFALPFFLRQDLNTVLADLKGCSFGLGQLIETELLSNATRSVWTADFGACTLGIEQAIEFWPLVGDVASQEHGGSRLVDSSTQRVQISLRRRDSDDEDWSGWQLQTGGFSLPLRAEKDEHGEIRLIGLRFRDFVPFRGLHPSIKAAGPLTLQLSHPARDEALEVTLHNWRYDGLPYDGLPRDLEDAAQRRAARLQVKNIGRAALAPAKALPATAVKGFTVDLRRL